MFGIDNIVTIVYRLKNKENIFEAHRSHLCQYLANELQLSHITVSVIYAIIQLLVNISIIVAVAYGYINAITALLILLLFGIVYLGIRSTVTSKL